MVIQNLKEFINKNFSYLAVGSFRETMRELADDLVLSSDTNIIVDSRESAMKEAGEIVQSKVRFKFDLKFLIYSFVFSRQILQLN